MEAIVAGGGREAEDVLVAEILLDLSEDVLRRSAFEEGDAAGFVSEA